jgi:hypothetical protein
VKTGCDLQDCSAFATTFEQGLRPGTYTVNVSLPGADRATLRTTTVGVSADVEPAAQAIAPVEFPMNSFYR